MALRIRNFRQGAEPRGIFHGAAANRSARPVPLKSKCDRDKHWTRSKLEIDFCSNSAIDNADN